ncbi:hypothetical protein T440DRAFT_80197 [Plenodomus tracheiphilus IPT5]|uniref:Uncharacterized protein n=1 Tax=Plenodomus tracheiphilus IPT5 TaxID=1408161 RepID=A0A6A7B8N6_9PLEO|nr:hypothetical protein T440DRAFT_80197 [Plenodomus tracheiphilus IPT5]
MPNAAFTATPEDAYPSVYPSAGACHVLGENNGFITPNGASNHSTYSSLSSDEHFTRRPPHSFPSSPIAHHTQGTHSSCAPAAPNKKRRRNISGIDAPHIQASEYLNYVSSSQVPRNGNHVKTLYHHATDSPIPTPMSTYQTEPNIAVGVKIFPYKDYTIGIPEDLSSNLSTLQKYQESAIDANAVYDVTKLTHAFYVGLQAGHCLFCFNSPPTRREHIDSGLYILSFVEKNYLVVAGIAIASYHKCQAMEMGHILVSLPENISKSQREFFSKFTIPAPRHL